MQTYIPQLQIATNKTQVHVCNVSTWFIIMDFIIYSAHTETTFVIESSFLYSATHFQKFLQVFPTGKNNSECNL